MRVCTKVVSISIGVGNRTSQNPHTITPIVLIFIHLSFSFTAVNMSYVCMFSFPICCACRRRSGSIQSSLSDVCQRSGGDVRCKLKFVSFHSISTFFFNSNRLTSISSKVYSLIYFIFLYFYYYFLEYLMCIVNSVHTKIYIYILSVTKEIPLTAIN